MARRWAWMGVMGVCALLSGCRERGDHDEAAPAAARAPAPMRPNSSPPAERMDMAVPSQETVALPGAAPAQSVTSAPPNTLASSIPSDTPPQRAVPTPAPAATGTPATTGTPVTSPGTTQKERESRVMIGLEAVQAREDEAWHEGAAKAARDFKQNEAVPLNKVVIATGTVDGRITRVDRSALHLRDNEGNVYQLRIDKQSRGLRQGYNVPLRQLEEGTQVRASFDLVGGHSVARDIEVRH